MGYSKYEYVAKVETTDLYSWIHHLEFLLFYHYEGCNKVFYLFNHIFFKVYIPRAARKANDLKKACESGLLPHRFLSLRKYVA